MLTDLLDIIVGLTIVCLKVQQKQCNIDNIQNTEINILFNSIVCMLVSWDNVLVIFRLSYIVKYFSNIQILKSKTNIIIHCKKC